MPPEKMGVPEIIPFIYYCIDRVTEKTVPGAIMKVFQLLVQSHTDEVILSLFKIKEQSQSGILRSWEILASFPKGYKMIMDYLLQRMLASHTPNDQQTDHKTELSAMIATRAIHEMLLVPSYQGEVQTYFAPLFVVLLFQISFLVTKESAVVPDERNESEYVDSVSSSVEALKTLMRSSGYTDHMSYIQTLGAWELLVSPERHYNGVTLLARSLAIKNCWHNRPVFSFLIRTLQDPHCANYFTALVFLAELLRCPDVAGAVDAVSTRILANWFHCEELSTGRLLLQIAEIFTKHKNTITHLRILQPYFLSYCYSTSSDLVMETFLTLQRILKNLTWQHFSTFITHLAFHLGHFFEEESEQLRLIIFTIYSSILAKVSRKTLDFPLKHQVLNSLVLLVSHLKDVNAAVEEVCRLSLCNTATILGWSKLKGVFAKKDVFTILIALLQQERSKVLWFLKQSVALFKSPQGPIRQVAVWFSGQIIRILNREEKEKIEDERAALMCMQKDPDPTVSCLTMQTFYILEAKNVVPEPKTFFSCLCSKKLQRR
ncbi:maestro heat-like repeat-containing protein family member 7 [Psammomys obesus]|uniref:maestro heat-like repeat-containing protein family member 7 n=1 Tax=Psammomys obesus TaxID=48139 RepID=UPI002452A5DD|nr:maestro heat-like repeat-containing protein family member 7 [Psammomys obesus]